MSKNLLTLVVMLGIATYGSAQTGLGIGTNNPAEKLEVNGAIKVGNTITSNDGTIRWTGTDFEGRKSGTWVSLTGSGVSGSGTTNFLAKWASPSSLGSSQVFDNGINVGIGTNIPAAKLHIEGNFRLTDGTQGVDKVLRSNSNGTATWVDISTLVPNDGDWTVSGNDIYSGVSGNVGVGTTLPIAELNVYDGSESATQTNFTQAVTNAGLLVTTDYTVNSYTPGVFWNTANNNSTKPKGGIYLQNTGSGSKMYFGTSDAYATGITNTAMVIGPTGNIGIGSTAPAIKLVVAGGTTANLSGGGYILTNDEASTNVIIDDTGIQARNNGSKSDLFLQRNGGDVIINDLSIGNGRVGIGTNAPAQDMEIYQDSHSILQLTSGNESSRLYLFSGSEEHAMIYLMEPDIGGQGFRVMHDAGSNRMEWAEFYGSASTIMYLETDGDLWVAGGYSSGSDKRFKTNIKPLESSLDKLGMVKGYSYNWKDPEKDKSLQYGVIAQELEEVYPDLVTEDAETGMKGVKYSGLIAPLIEAVKELKAENDDLKYKYDEVLKRLEKMEKN